jgi:hypothetical protein
VDHDAPGYRYNPAFLKPRMRESLLRRWGRATATNTASAKAFSSTVCSTSATT